MAAVARWVASRSRTISAGGDAWHITRPVRIPELCSAYGRCRRGRAGQEGEAEAGEAERERRGGSEQSKVNAFRDHYFTNILAGTRGFMGNLTGVRHRTDHNDHLHSGDFDSARVVVQNPAA